MSAAPPDGPERTEAPARALLVECLLGIAGSRPRLRALASEDAAWEPLLALARARAVAETVCHALAAHAALAHVPEESRRALREAHEGAAARNALLLAEAAAVQGALAADGVPSAWVKGVALVAAHYPALGARHVADLDLLVGPERLDAAVGVVRRLGGRRLAPPLDARGEGAEKHAPALVLPSGALVELHRRFGADPATEAATEPVLGRARAVAWAGRSLRVASPDDLLAVACHHVLVDHRADPRYVPRHLADCAVLLAAGASPARAATLPGAAEPVRASLALLERAARGDPGAASAALAAPPGGPLGRLAGLGRWVARDPPGRALRKVLFPDRDFMAWRYGVARGSPVLPLLYLWRPFRGAWRMVSGR